MATVMAIYQLHYTDIIGVKNVYWIAFFMGSISVKFWNFMKGVHNSPGDILFCHS